MPNNVWLKAQEHEKSYQKVKKKRQFYPEASANELTNNFNLRKAFFNSKKVLEIGAHPASPINGLSDAALTVGVDPLAKYYTSAGNYSAMSIQCRGEELPFVNGIFDVAICLNVLDHTEKPQTVLNQIKHSLKGNGIFLLSIDTFQMPKFIRKTILSFIDPTHPYHFSTKEMKYLLDNANFSSVVVKKNNENFAQKMRHTHKFFVNGKKKEAIKFLVANVLFGLDYVFFFCTNSQHKLSNLERIPV